jgi:dihydroxy-acid dehydratase
VDERALELELQASEIERRLAEWTPPPAAEASSVLARYAALVGSASDGAVLALAPREA